MGLSVTAFTRSNIPKVSTAQAPGSTGNLAVEGLSVIS